MAVVNSSRRTSRFPVVMAARLRDVRRRESSLRLVAGLLDAFALFLAAMFMALVLDWTFTLFNTSVRAAFTYAALGAGGLGLLLLAVIPQLRRRSLPDVAAAVDRSIPALEERWQTVTEMSESADTPAILGSPVMLDRVIIESVAREHLVKPETIAPSKELRAHQWILAGAIAANILLFVVDAPRVWTLVRRFCFPTSPISLTEVTAASGDLAAARGESVRLEATVARRVPDRASLFLRKSDGQIQTIAISATVDDRARFIYSTDAAEEPFSYRFRAGDGQTDWHTVTVHDRPRLLNIDFRLRPPGYTRLPAVVKSELPTTIRAVEGSELEIGFVVDQPLQQFHLDLGKEPRIALLPDRSDPHRYVFRIKLEKTVRLMPIFVSQHGLSNLRMPACQIVVFPDRPPEVTIVSPEREISVRPDDEVVIEIHARDDFGVVRAEVVAFVGEQPDLQNAQSMPLQPEQEVGKGEASASPAQNRAVAGGAPGSASEKTLPPTTSPVKSMSSLDAKKAAPQSKDEASNGQPPVGGESERTAPRSGKPGVLSTVTKSQNLIPARKDPKSQGPSAEKPKTIDASSGPAQPSSQSISNTSENGGVASTSPTTLIIPFPMNAQAGEKKVRVKVKLDLRKFQLKQGQELKYVVRVYDSRNGTSKGQSYSEPANSSAARATAVQATTATPTAKRATPPSAPSAEQRNASTQAAIASTQASTDPTHSRVPESAQIGTAQPDTSRPNGSEQTSAAERQEDSMKAQSPGSDSQQSSRGTSAQPNSSPEPQSGKSQSDSSSNPPQGEMTGAPPPPDSMTRRRLDVDSQLTASSTMRIHIDQWAGTFQGQQRQKLEILIDPVLKELDATLAKAMDVLRPVAVDLNIGRSPGDNYKKSVRAADTQIAHGQALVAELVQKTDGTPYAFIGLQLVDITELHISPARADVKAAKPESPDKKQRIHHAVVHLKRAREMLAELTRTYEGVKRDLKLAEDMQRIKKMYQVFVEETMALLQSQRPNLNPKNRKIAELELDEEFLKKYAELQKQWEKILAELAKTLAKDPRLLARYMSLSRRSADSLRDQLTILHNRQQDLLGPVEQLSRGPKIATSGAAPSSVDAEENRANRSTQPAPPPSTKSKDSPKRNSQNRSRPNMEQAVAGFDAARASLRRDLAEIATGAVAVQEDLGIWLPKNFKPDDATITPLREQAALVSTVAALAVTADGGVDGPTAAAKKVDELSAQLKSLESLLAKLSDNDDPQLATHINRRLAHVRKLQQLTGSWIEKSVHAKEMRLHRVLELDQHRLSEDTLELTNKLENLGAQLAGLPDDILTLGDELKDTIRYEVLVDQMAAELGLRDRNLEDAIEHQKKAIDGFTRAEGKFDKLIDRVIHEQDKVPPEVPDIDNMQLQTLKELLAQLENEADLAEDLGIPNRPTNLQTLRDWLMRSGSGNGGGRGGGMTAGARMRAQLAERAREDALQAAQKASPRVRATASRWNTLGSRLEDTVRQSRGNTPPKQYRRAIERYFELISGAQDTSESGAPGADRKNSK